MSLSLSALSKSYQGTQALQPCSLSLQTGQLGALLGPSGCGKTTLLKLIAGLEVPDQGNIAIAGQTVFDHGSGVNMAVAKRRLGMVFQDFALWPHLSVFENVAFGLRAQGRVSQLKHKVMRALEQVQLAHLAERLPAQLSGGQQQRVSLARAIVTEPQLILLDEPLSALDAKLRESMQTLLMQVLKENGLTAVYVTHDQSEAMAMADQVFVMQQGQIVQQGTPQQIYSQPSHPFVADFIGRSNVLPGSQGRRLLRVEHVLIEQTERAIAFEATVRQGLYQGSHYLIEAEVADQRWLFHSRQPMAGGQSLTLYGENHQIIEL